jgi:hypothetical protein
MSHVPLDLDRGHPTGASAAAGTASNRKDTHGDMGRVIRAVRVRPDALEAVQTFYRSEENR